MSKTRDDLCFAGASEQARMVREHVVTATDLVEATLERIASVDATINAYRVVLGEQARADAERIDTTRADPGQTMLGVPVAIKDTIAVRGETSTWGTSANATPAQADAPIVAALRRAGAIIIGKTTCSELAAWPITETAAWGRTRNPWNTDHSPGGSSGGSAAAVAAGLCGAAIGSDGLGSIRAPSGFTGVFGLKPQRGRVWHDPRNWHGLAVNGPIARTVADAALVLDAVAARPPPSPFISHTAHTPRRLRIAIARKPLARYPLSARLGAAQKRAVDEYGQLLSGLGHDVFDRELSFSRHASSNLIVRYLSGVAESAEFLEEPDRLSGRTRTIVRYGRRVSAGRLERALASEELIARAMNAIFDDADLVLTPGAVQPPLRIGQLDALGSLRAFDASGRIIPHYGPWNLIGQPAASVPAGFDSGGLPVSVQLAGRQDDEAALLSVAAEIEAARPWADRRPPSA